MNYRALVQTIARTLSKVQGVGKVHPVRRFARTPGDIAALFTVDGKLNGWTVSRSGFSNEHLATDETHFQTHVFVVRGFVAWTSEHDSELEFNATIDRIADAFSPSSDLGEDIELAGPVTAREIDYVQTGETLAHYCELEIPVDLLVSY